VLLLPALLLVIGACSGREAGGQRGGGEVRIAALAPAAVEIITALGHAGRIVAVGDYVHWPPATDHLPRIGSWDAPHVERLLELEVTLLVTVAGRAGNATRERLADLGLDVLALRTDTLEGTWDSFLALGGALGARERSEQCVRFMQAALDSVADLSRGAEPRPVAIVVGTEPLYSAGPGSHLHELLRIAGAENVFADLASPYGIVSREALIARGPAVIVDLSDNRPGAPRGRTAAGWEEWSSLPAVTAGEVHQLDPDRLTIPGPRLPEMALLLARIVHPEIFGEPGENDYGPLR